MSACNCREAGTFAASPSHPPPLAQAKSAPPQPWALGFVGEGGDGQRSIKYRSCGPPRLTEILKTSALWRVYYTKALERVVLRMFAVLPCVAG
jgi:hypothetical protein